MSETENNAAREEAVVLKGEISRRVLWWPARAVLVMTGLVLVHGLLELFARYCVGFRRRATASIRDSALTLTEEWSVLGRPIRRARTTAPVKSVEALRFEKRQRYLYLLLGLGCLMVGTLIGMQLFVDGLRAGYPYLTLLGAGLVAAGVALDLALYLFVPKGYGRNHVLLQLGRYNIRLAGVDSEEAERFGAAVHRIWQGR